MALDSRRVAHVQHERFGDVWHPALLSFRCCLGRFWLPVPPFCSAMCLLSTAFVTQSSKMLRCPTGQSSNQGERLSLVHGLILLTIKLACDIGEMLPTCIYR